MTSARLYDHPKLYSIRPEGNGTGLVESLSSYVCRLASAHHLFVGRLIRDAVWPELEPAAAATGLDWAIVRSGVFDGASTRVSLWVSVLEALTGIDSLDTLTLLDLMKAFADPAMLRNKGAMCPDCLDEDLKSGRPYERLAWRVDAVKVCLVHRRPLQWICPECCRLRADFWPTMIVGYCGAGHWMGRKSRAEEVPLDPWQERASRLVVDWLGVRAGWEVRPQDVLGSIEVAIDKRADGQQCALARAIGVSSAAVSHWMLGEARPTLENVLRIAALLGSDLDSVFRGDPELGQMPPLTTERPAADYEMPSQPIVAELDEIKKRLGRPRTCGDPA